MKMPAPKNIVLNKSLLEFLKTEAGSGSILAICAIVAVVWANSPFAESYFGFIHHHFTLSVPGWSLDESVLEWTKEGLMAIFFFVVGLEIKYEIFRGELSSPQKLALPVIAAIGGMVVPALVYAGINLLPGGDLRGWSVPMATDIAFALAILGLVGKSLPASLRVFLLTLAIVDDLGAVMVIGIFYSHGFQVGYLVAVAALLAVMASVKFVSRSPFVLYPLYAVLFVLIWAMSIKSGLGPSLVAVMAAFCVTLDPGKNGEPVLKQVLHYVHPYVAFGILPFFAFTASGFSLAGAGVDSLTDPRFLGVTLGLFAGKQLGIFFAAWLAMRLKLAAMPEGATAWQLYGVCLLCGIGFTMSLYLGALAFPAGDEAAQIAVKSGVVLGSLLSGCAGALWLSRKRSQEKG
ncbi:Na+/H+ antiporter NhaA [Asticcacaulis taihuensis]|uniref:Na(+)/H(+) antiporter NhaA n=1 Tax=Asticcacaulis taihuensis TaxID=260084 RepID=A0A1G4S2L3_9CAUL|nr:Na+/H+ antiporter NhaA [Asticcacaulis taihuensis]SCW63268.1 Na+:H+ antiporter, NhaA family [Asticcacaulis taihuensis]